MADSVFDSAAQNPEGAGYLEELALDLRNTWEHGTDEIWRRLEPELWASTHNPRVVLQTVSRTRLREALADAGFLEMLTRVVLERRRAAQVTTWFQHNYANPPFNCVAYFSMEFGLSEALPIYSGGLGNVAGDQLKAAHDLGVPLIGVGLLYQRGYFRQYIDADGNQTALFPYNDPGQLPITPVRNGEGEWVRLKVRVAGPTLWIRAWEARVGRLKLYLLDTNDPANAPVYRGVTSELYGAGEELRLHQSMVLGLGGWRLLHKLGLNPEVCHLNEGHAAFAVLERARQFMFDHRQPFDVALTATRAGNLFTTHTPVPAGFDRFDVALMERYMKRYSEDRLQIDFDSLLALGRQNPNDASEPFNMAYLAIRGSGAINAVSALHGRVSRHIFAPLFSNWPIPEIPIGHVTNGVHTPTWDSVAADELWTKACGAHRWRETMEGVGERIGALPSEELWAMRGRNRQELVTYVRERIHRSGADDTQHTEHDIFDPNILTLGFARRFATYKRPNLLLHDPERLARILLDRRHPVQLVVAGKAHPADEQGKTLVKAWIKFVARPELRKRVVFLTDYDMLLAEYLVRGVDIWINTPRRPWEACGTSGMKILVNGGLNLSELDGWWAEAYSPEVGWALGDGLEHDADPAWDAFEADQLYTLLEKEIVSTFYDRDAMGIPQAWVEKVRASMSRLTPQFSANRTIRDYVTKYYVPAAVNYKKRVANHCALAIELTSWRQLVERCWPDVYFGNFDVHEDGDTRLFQVQVYLDPLIRDAVEVELFAAESDDHPIERFPMTRCEPLVGATGWTFRASVRSGRPTTHFTPRVIPRHPDAAIPLESNAIKWQR
ncbi:MAG TPA: alpha-glucan family phosphorylase [Candidatus Binataceae bacterium]|nr:alpha-glucan family phosphorylase [Candidatus Binataceae bacterium]